MNSELNLVSITLVILIIGFSIYALSKMNQKIKEKIKIEKIVADSYKIQLKKIKKINSTEIQLDEIKKLAKVFFRNKLKISQKLTFPELAKEFERLKKPVHEKFCMEISEILYSGTELNKKNSEKLIKDLEKIINEED